MPRRKKSNPLAGLVGIAVIAVLCCGGGVAIFNGVDSSGPDTSPGVEAPAANSDDEPADESVDRSVDEPEAPAADEPEPVVEEEPADEPAEDAYYRNCTEARAAGAAPLHRGDPGYRAGLDRDDDGTACEN
ncbi:MAG TPA: excalibur calcium-binding domain-containing protein [Asanoa sp.]|nr:excalibur calcium-binding domain-containing protein [Asanoa sp.]